METVLLYIVGILVVVVGIAVSIGLHELGHLIPAKLFGVRVSQYMIGFGPTIFSRKKGETEYGLKAIPLGGYIAMAGMYPPAREGSKPKSGFINTMVQEARTASSDAVPVGAENRVFYKLPIWKRIIIMFGGPFVNLVIATVLFGIILTGFGIQTLSVGSVSQCVVPAPSTRTTCQSTDAIAPAALAGLKPGDQIIGVGSLSSPTWDQVTALIRKSSGQPIQVTVVRAGVTKTLAVTPLLTTRDVLTAAGKPVKNADGTTKTSRVGFIGVGPAYPLAKQPFGNALPLVGNNIGHDFQIIGTLPQRLVQVAQAAFGTEARDPNGPVGVVGVGRLAGEVAATTAIPWAQRLSGLLGLVASLNVALFAFNMIPLLPLDGGHIIGAVWEGIRKTFAKIFKRKDPGPVDIARLVPLTYVVIFVLGGMSLLLVYADIVKPITLQ